MRGLVALQRVARLRRNIGLLLPHRPNVCPKLLPLLRLVYVVCGDQNELQIQCNLKIGVGGLVVTRNRKEATLPTDTYRVVITSVILWNTKQANELVLSKSALTIKHMGSNYHAKSL